MADALDPATSPAGLPPVRRLNKLPLLILGAVLVVVVLVLLFAAMGRGGVEEGGDGIAVSEPLEVRGTRPRFADVIEGHEESFEIEAAPVVTPAPETPARPPPRAPVRPAPAVAEIDEWRLELLRDAVGAGTTVPGSSAVLEVAGGREAVLGADAAGVLDRALAAAQGAAAPDPNLRDRKEVFAGREKRFGYSFEARRPQVGRFELKVGTVVPALLISGINSDLPGTVLAQVARAVRDTRSGTAVLIPRGARLVGSYDHHVAMGQRRVMAAWHRVQFPDGSTFELGGMPGADAAGFTGLRDRVENRLLRAFGAATMLSVIGAGAQISQPAAREDDPRIPPGQQVTGELGRQWGELGEEMARGNLQIQPTLRIRPGYRFNVMVTKDLILPRYRAPGEA